MVENNSARLIYTILYAHQVLLGRYLLQLSRTPKTPTKPSLLPMRYLQLLARRTGSSKTGHAVTQKDDTDSNHLKQSGI